jgi:hypothetical protein
MNQLCASDTHSLDHGLVVESSSNSSRRGPRSLVDVRNRASSLGTPSRRGVSAPVDSSSVTSAVGVPCSSSETSTSVTSSSVVTQTVSAEASSSVFDSQNSPSLITSMDTSPFSFSPVASSAPSRLPTEVNEVLPLNQNPSNYTTAVGTAFCIS